MHDMSKTVEIQWNENFFFWVNARCKEDACVLTAGADQLIVLSLDYGNFPESTTWVAVLDAPRETDPNRNHILDALKKDATVELRLSLKCTTPQATPPNPPDAFTRVNNCLLFTHVKSGRWIMQIRK